MDNVSSFQVFHSFYAFLLHFQNVSVSRPIDTTLKQNLKCCLDLSQLEELARQALLK